MAGKGVKAVGLVLREPEKDNRFSRKARGFSGWCGTKAAMLAALSAGAVAQR
jgi:hypothetical protein